MALCSFVSNRWPIVVSLAQASADPHARERAQLAGALGLLLVLLLVAAVLAGWFLFRWWRRRHGLDRGVARRAPDPRDALHPWTESGRRTLVDLSDQPPPNANPAGPRGTHPPEAGDSDDGTIAGAWHDDEDDEPQDPFGLFDQTDYQESSVEDDPFFDPEATDPLDPPDTPDRPGPIDPNADPWDEDPPPGQVPGDTSGDTDDATSDVNTHDPDTDPDTDTDIDTDADADIDDRNGNGNDNGDDASEDERGPDDSPQRR